MGDYTVTYISSNSVFTDITKFVHSLDKTSFYSDGRIYTTALTLQADFGQFMTDSRSGSTPIIKQFDRIQIRYTDSSGDFYEHIFQVINNLGQGTNQADYLLPLTLEGREQNMAFIPFSGFFDPPISHLDISQKILSVYGFSKNSATQPTISDQSPGKNELPSFNPNFWDFQYIDNCLDATKEVVRSADLSVAAGGGGDRFSIVFNDFGEGQAVDLNVMNIEIASQGTNNEGDPFVTITGDAVFNPIQVIDKVKQPFTGTVIVARGRPGSGGTPRQGDQYRARLEFYETTPSYVDTTQYREGVFVSFGNQITNPELASPQVYQADQDTLGNLPTNATFWTPISAFVFIGDIDYSPLTILKKGLYKNECTNPSEEFNFNSNISPKMLDCNIVINDVETQRDWVYFRSNTDVEDDLGFSEKQYLFLGTGYYPGFRILVDVANLGTGEGTFNPNLNRFNTGLGRDPNGKLYANNAVIFVAGEGNLDPLGQGGTWYVIREQESFDQILVRLEGLFEFNVNFASGSRFPASDPNPTVAGTRRFRSSTAGTPDAWRKIEGQWLANDCLHSPSSIENVDGLTKTVNRDSGSATYQTNSAIQIIYEYGSTATEPIDEWRMILDQIAGRIFSGFDFITQFATNAALNALNLFFTPQYTNVGWWITFTTPWPFNTFNGVTEEVGGIYGGKTLAELQNHPYFDAFNQRVAYSGKAGWNEEDSADLMELTGAKFLFQLDIQANGKTIPFTGEIPCSYWAIDDNGTIWKQKKTVRFLNDIRELSFDFGDFKPVYRARSPYGIQNIVTNILVPELEIRERLFPARIKIQGFMLELAYDDHGRYMPSIAENIIKPSVFGMFDTSQIGTGVKFIGTIDAFQWVKTPIAIENGSSLGETPDRVIFPSFRDYPNITNIEQLQRAATADFDTEFFQFEQYSLVQNDRADVNLQDTVYLRDPFLIPDADQTLDKTNAFLFNTNYVLNDIVNELGIIYEAIQASVNKVPDQSPDFWNPLGNTAVPNTREVVLSEMVLSVTNGKDWNREATFVRRIPKKIG